MGDQPLAQAVLRMMWMPESVKTGSLISPTASENLHTKETCSGTSLNGLSKMRITSVERTNQKPLIDFSVHLMYF